MKILLPLGTLIFSVGGRTCLDYSRAPSDGFSIWSRRRPKWYGNCRSEKNGRCRHLNLWLLSRFCLENAHGVNIPTMSGTESASDVSSDGDVAHFYRPSEYTVYFWAVFLSLLGVHGCYISLKSASSKTLLMQLPQIFERLLMTPWLVRLSSYHSKDLNGVVRS